MKHLKSYTKLFESKSEIMEFVDYLKHDLQDDDLAIRESDTRDFLIHKYKSLRSQSYKFEEGRKKRYEESIFMEKEALVFDLINISHKKYGLSTYLNLYDAEPHVKRLLDYAKGLGYNNFEVRKITQMSRKSQDVTKSFTGKGRLPESAKREILILQILIMK